MIVIQGGTILSVTDGVIEGGSVLLGDDGKIADVFMNHTEVPGASVVDARGKYVVPGFVDAHTHLGICNLEVGEIGEDENEMSNPSTPACRALDAVYVWDSGFGDALSGGVTTVFTGPGSGNVIGGQSITMKTAGASIEEMVLQNPAGLKTASGENPKRVYKAKNQLPTTRMGTAKVLREALSKAQDYKERRAGPEPPAVDLDMEVLCRVLSREIPLRTHSHRADDMMTMVRIRDEFNIRMVIEHGTDSTRIRHELAEAGIAVITGPLLDVSPKVETASSSFATPHLLHEAGVLAAIMTDHPVIPIESLRLEAAIAAYEGGAGEQEALEFITINPARILGLEERIGSIVKGKDADVVIWSGHPFKASSIAEKTFVNGKLAWEVKA
ncbi:MAG: amidohydrolase [Candidatus Cryosericum sp.]|nr:amidohydrolase [bacterium]